MDLRGHGDSDATFSSYDDVAAGTDMVALVERPRRARRSSSATRWVRARRWAPPPTGPDLVRGLVLVGPFVRNLPMGLATKLTLPPRAAQAMGPGGRGTPTTRRSTPGGPRRTWRSTGPRIRESLRRPGHWRAFVATTHTSHAPAEARLGDVHAPTLVVMGERDADFPDPAAEARLIGDRFGARVVMVPDAGHYPQAEYPEVVTPAVVGFLAEATGRA